MASSDVDRGWAWMIVASTFVMCGLTMGMPWAASGVYTAIFLKAFPDATAATVAWATSSTSAVSYFMGPVGSILVSRYGLRFPALLGGIMASSGFIISFFAPGIHFLIFSYGILTGAGLGIAHISGNSAIAHYFDRHIGIATGLALSGTGITTFIFAPLITFLDENYGWRGSLLIVGGITLNMCVCAMVSRRNTRVEKKTNLSWILDFDLFKIVAYNLNVICATFVSFGICIVFVHIIAFAESQGYSPTQSSMLVSCIGIANLVSRFILPMTTKLKCVNTCILYCVCYILSGVTACLYPFFGHSYPALMILSACFGIFTVSYGAIMTILLVEMVGSDRFANAYGYLLLFMGLGHISGGPTAGFLFDITQQYNVSLFTGGGAIIVGGAIPLLSLFPPFRDPPRQDSFDIVIEEKNPLQAPVT